MLVGTFPFDKAIIEDFIGYIRECHPYDVSAIFQVDSEMLDPLTKNAQDLILQMLNTDPKKRITLGEVMAHPWVRAGGTIRKEGYLEKNRRMFNKKYWCTLGKGEFRYYTDKSMKALHHAIHIGECKLLVGKGSDLSIILIDRHDDDKEYKFLASDAEDRVPQRFLRKLSEVEIVIGPTQRRAETPWVRVRWNFCSKRPIDSTRLV